MPECPRRRQVRILLRVASPGVWWSLSDQRGGGGCAGTAGRSSQGTGPGGSSLMGVSGPRGGNRNGRIMPAPVPAAEATPRQRAPEAFGASLGAARHQGHQDRSG
jgi:hypothetical protein